MRKILILDDDCFIRKALKELLNDEGYTVFECEDGQKGLNFVLERGINCVDLMLVDLKMPNLNGIEFIEKIRNLNKNIPIILISAHSEYNFLQEDTNLNINKFVFKPFDNNKLIKIVEDAIV